MTDIPDDVLSDPQLAFEYAQNELKEHNEELLVAASADP